MKAFDEVAKNIGFTDLVGKANASKEVLRELGNQICLCRLRDKDANDRDILRRIFFGLKPELSSSSVSLRRQTLCRILMCSDFAAAHGFKLSDQHFLDACYFRQMCENGEVHEIHIREAFDDVAMRWKIFRAHDYLSYSAEALLCCFLKFINEESSGGNMDDFVGRITELHLLEEMSKLTSAVFDDSDLSQVSVKDALDSLTKAEGLCRFTGHEPEVSRKFDSSVLASSHFSEYNEMKMMEYAGNGESFEPRGIYVSWMPLLFSTYLRFVWVSRTNQKVWYWLKHHTVTDISPARASVFLNWPKMVLISEPFRVTIFRLILLESFCFR